jgi:choline-glycine betaine transporter
MRFVALISTVCSLLFLYLQWYYLFFASMFVLFVALTVLACRLGRKIDVSHMPGSKINSL